MAIENGVIILEGNIGAGKTTLAHFWKHETVRLLKPHHLVVGLQSEHSVLEEREAATVLWIRHMRSKVQ